MPRRIILLPRAQKDLSELPTKIHDQVIAKIQLLYDFPEMGAPMFEAYEGYRALLAAGGRYRIIYRVMSEDLIEVAYIRHCARRLPKSSPHRPPNLPP